MEVQPSEEETLEENQKAWTLVKRRQRKTLQLPNSIRHDEKLRTRRKPRNNQKRKSKFRSTTSFRSTEVESHLCVHSKQPTLGDYFPNFFDKECFTSNVIHVDEKNEMKNISRGSSEKKKTISRLNNIPSNTSLMESLNLPFDDRMTLIAALIDPEAYEGKILTHMGTITKQDYIPLIWNRYGIDSIMES